MCGIVGVFSLGGMPLPPFNREAALAVLSHRGPDEEGVYSDHRAFLGVRRLAIIDPQHGHQPVQSETGRFRLVMNGEIYDHDRFLEQIAARGHRLASRCDTEVAVHLFEESGPAALDAIDGQYALAVYDSRDAVLFLARDRMGICPLYYAQKNGLLVFASEMKAIFATGLVEPEIDPRSLDAVAAFGCVPPPGTIFRGARRRLRADVPVGLYLSGGIDSATVAALTADAPGIRSRVFSIGFPEPGFDESDNITRLARHLGLHDRSAAASDAELVELPRERLARWDLMNRSLYVSSRIFLQGHLLSTHGDREIA